MAVDDGTKTDTPPKAITEGTAYDRLVATVWRGDLHRPVAGAAILQLVGGEPKPNAIGPDTRGDIHLAVIFDARVNQSAFLSKLADLTTGGYQTHGTKTTFAGLMVSSRGAGLDYGPVLDPDVEHLYIERADMLGESVQDALEQVLAAGEYSITTEQVRKTVDATGSILLTVSPVGGTSERYRVVDEELPLPPGILGSVDLVYETVPHAERDPVRDRFGDPNADPLDAEEAREIITYARNHDLRGKTQDAVAGIEAFVQFTLDERDEESYMGINLSELYQTLDRLSEASAKLRNAEKVSKEDVRRAVALTHQSYVTFGITNLAFDPYQDSSEGDYTVAEEAVRNTVKSKIRTHPLHEVPEDKIIAEAQDHQISAQEVKRILAALESEGEIRCTEGGYVLV